MAAISRTATNTTVVLTALMIRPLTKGLQQQPLSQRGCKKPQSRGHLCYRRSAGHQGLDELRSATDMLEPTTLRDS